jgi:ribosome maturation factor RimP
MALKDQISELVTPAVSDLGFYLEDVHVATPGSHCIVTCIVDGDASLNLDQVTSVSRVISELLDEAAFMGETPFTLEVTSPGVDRPLTQPRHFAKNVDRLLKIIKLDGSEVTGRILSNTDQDVTLTVTVKKETFEQTVSLSEIKRAVVEIEFNRKDDK